MDKATVSVFHQAHVGYDFGGETGWVGVSNVRCLEIVSLGLVLLHRDSSPLLWFPVFVGKSVHVVHMRRLLWSWLDSFWLCMRQPEYTWRPRFMGREAKSEVLGLLLTLSLCGTSIKDAIDPVVTASDASETGLGVSRSVGLSDEGFRLVSHLVGASGLGTSPLPVLGPVLASPRIMVPSLFDGIDCLRRSLGRLQLSVILSVSVEDDTRAQRVVRAAWPGTIEYHDVRDLGYQLLFPLFETGASMGCELAIAGGGFPCQDVSRLKQGRAGATEGARTSLFVEWVRICHSCANLADDFKMKYIGIGECTVMDAKDEQAISSAILWPRFELCSSGASRVRRPRYFWTTDEPSERPGFERAETWKGARFRSKTRLGVQRVF